METKNLDPPEPPRRIIQKRVDALLLEGLNSGEPIPVRDEFWEQKKRRLIERFGGVYQTASTSRFGVLP